jgi:hypothetical protein
LLGVVAHTFNPSTREAEAGGFLSSRPAWSTKRVPGQPGLYRETLSQKNQKQKKKKKKTLQNYSVFYLIQNISDYHFCFEKLKSGQIKFHIADRHIDAYYIFLPIYVN